MLKIAFREEAMGRSQTYEWWKRFNEVRTSVDDDPRSGRPSTSKTDNVAKVREVIRSNRRLSVREVAEEVSISKTVCHEILTENLGMHRIAAKFVPHLLTDDQKQNRVDVSQELLDRANDDDDNFLKNIITGDETWVYGYGVETKVQSSQWVSKTSSRPKKSRQVRSHVKVVLTLFFYSEGVVHYEFLPQGRTVNKE